jgi:hypothetical protein
MRWLLTRLAPGLWTATPAEGCGCQALLPILGLLFLVLYVIWCAVFNLILRVPMGRTVPLAVKGSLMSIPALICGLVVLYLFDALWTGVNTPSWAPRRVKVVIAVVCGVWMGGGLFWMLTQFILIPLWRAHIP